MDPESVSDLGEQGLLGVSGAALARTPDHTSTTVRRGVHSSRSSPTSTLLPPPSTAPDWGGQGFLGVSGAALAHTPGGEPFSNSKHFEMLLLRWSSLKKVCVCVCVRVRVDLRARISLSGACLVYL